MTSTQIHRASTITVPIFFSQLFNGFASQLEVGQLHIQPLFFRQFEYFI